VSPIRQVLVHVTDSPHASQVLALGAAVAQAQGAALAAMYAVDPAPPGAYLTPEASSLAMRLVREADEARREAARAVVAAAAAAAGCEMPLAIPGGDALRALLDASQTTDLLVMGQHDPAQPGGVGASLAGRVLVSAGCPVLFAPSILGTGRQAGTPLRCGQRVLLAWSGKRESARALRDALPLLRQAHAVEVLRIETHEPEPGEPPITLDDVAAHLSRHGITARCSVRHSAAPSMLERMQRAWVPDAPVAEALLSQAADSGADLIVTGGFGHSRAWELALGGVTRTLLQSMTVPVWMSH
jgi:nucleotide-binding universal stress UspA family protein